MRNENRIRRKGILILLNLALIVSGLFSYPIPSYAERVVLSEQTYYHLDMGVQVTYQGSEWESRGYRYGDTENMSATISFPQNIEVIDAYPLNSSKGGSFDFDGNTSSTNIPSTLKSDAGGSAANAYNQFYKDYVSTSMQASGTPSSSGAQVSFSYTVKLNTSAPLEVVELGKYGFVDEIWKLFGGKNNVQNAQVKAAIENALLQGRDGTANGNKLYLVFCPTVIEYKKYITVGDLEADLDLPQSAKQGESFTVSDASLVDSGISLDTARIRYRVDGGAWQNLVTWPGTGKPGVNTGGTIDQQFDTPCIVDYEIFDTASNGQTSTKIKTINITDGREIDGKAVLLLPEYTYEGHPALAEDHSTFKVDGVNYSARRAYEEEIAENDFIPLSTYGTATKKSLTTADVVFTKRGTYNVKLEVNTVSGATLTDIKPIEVRKTPYIIDSLGGFQKENRKQILGISVATYPGKPIVDYSIKLKDMITGQEITLTKDQPQQNNATIKTRAITNSGDSYWTNFELLFLTKNTSEQQYQYTVYMKDSKGDTDTVQKTFTVKPDLPPVPAIVIQDSFIRNKGTNVAEILTEDASTTDGDQLERTWSVEGQNVKDMDGFKDLSFGTGQKVKFNKTGVGKTDVDLFLKDVWIEPTLEEYVTDADHKTATTTKTTDVINIAPTVRLEPINTKQIDITLLTDKKSKAQIGASINTLKAALIEMGLDPHISLAVAADADDGGYRKVASWTWDTTVNCGMCMQNAGQMDSDFVYRITSPGKYVDGYQERCKTDQPHILQALSAGKTANSGYVAWSYPVNESRSFTFYLDNKEKYVYISCWDINKTIVLNRDNGAYLTTLGMAIPGAPFINDDAQNLYFVGGSSITKYDTSSGTYSTVMNRGGSLAQMMDGKVVFVGKKEPAVKQNKNGVGLYIGKFDMNTETIEEISIPELPNTKGIVGAMDIDSKGKVLFKQGSDLWVADSQKQTVKMTSGVRTRTGNDENYSESTVFVKNEKGEGVYVAISAFSAYRSNGLNYQGEFTLYDFAGQDSIVATTGWRKEYWYYNMSSISYAKLHSQENKIYILIGNQMQGNDWGGSVEGMLFRISLPSFSIDTSMNNWGWDVADESGAYSGSLMRTFYAFDKWTGMSDRINIFRNSISEQEAKTLALRKNAQSGNSDSDKYVIVAGDDTAKQILNIQDFKNEIDLRGAKSLFYDLKDTIGSIADQIEDLGDSVKNFFLLEGDNFSNLASVEHSLQFLPNTEYEYQYDMTTTGKAIDLFGVKNPNSKGLENDGKYFEKTAAFIDFNSGLAEPFFTMTGGKIDTTSNTKLVGYGVYNDVYGDAAFQTTFNMEKDGYVSFDLYLTYSGYKSNTNWLYYTVDGKSVGLDAVGGYNTYSGVPRIIYLTSGSHTIYFYHKSEAVFGNSASINNLKAVYFEDTADGFTPAKITNSNNGEMQTVSSSFRVAGQEGVETLKDITKTMTTKSGIEYSKYISSSSWAEQELWDSARRTYYWETRNTGPFSFNESTGIYSLAGGYERAYPSFSITAPPDKFLIYSYTMSFSGGRNNQDTSQPGEKLYPGTEIRILRPGQSQTLSANLYYYDKGGSSKVANMYVYNIKIAEFDAADFGGAAAIQAIGKHVDGKSINAPGAVGESPLLFTLDETSGSVRIRQLKDLPDSTATLNNGFGLSTSESTQKISALISNFSLYQKIGGIKQLIFSQNFNSQNALDLTGWHSSVVGDGKAEIVSAKPPIKEEDEPLVYKKGQLVAYNIFYDDYENDPSQKQFWRYTHTPYNDGPNPQAAFILDEDGNVISSTGAILSESIPRFYVDGKYTVEHWQLDNTNRTGDTSGKVDYSKYDKLSNIESLTFYIEGGASAPWITSIKTIPGTLKEGDSYRIQVGVDDAEKDELRLTTELYKDKKLIYTHKQTGIIADANGNYPLTTTGYPPLAKGGKYEVVCTVRDWSGAGIGYYTFTVIAPKVDATVDATDSLKSGYGISATVRTKAEYTTVAKVVATMPSGVSINMVQTGGSGNDLVWQFPVNTGKYAEQYNSKFHTTSRQVFVPVKWPDNTYYTITYKVYDSGGVMRKEISSKTYVNGNMYDDDYTVISE